MNTKVNILSTYKCSKVVFLQKAAFGALAFNIYNRKEIGRECYKCYVYFLSICMIYFAQAPQGTLRCVSIHYWKPLTDELLRHFTHARKDSRSRKTLPFWHHCLLGPSSHLPPLFLSLHLPLSPSPSLALARLRELFPSLSQLIDLRANGVQVRLYAPISAHLNVLGK